MGYTQRRAAELLGYKYRSSISQIENGHMRVTPQVAKICRLLLETKNDTEKI
jgi:transcriptional regulator with XRE-family HTH domain